METCLGLCMETCLDLSMDYLYGIYMYGTLVWNFCMESMDLLVRKPS